VVVVIGHRWWLGWIWVVSGGGEWFWMILGGGEWFWMILGGDSGI
jgi:hypothetical protein